MDSSSATPAWRQGPEEKPVLCNACGLRYQNWGNLEDHSLKRCFPKELVTNSGNSRNNSLKESSSSIDVSDSDNGMCLY